MGGYFTRYVGAFERFLRIDETISADARLHARITYLCCFAYLSLLIVNVLYFAIRYQALSLDAPILIVLCIIISSAIVSLRWTKSATIYGMFAAILPIASVYASATSSTSTDISMAMGGGINTPSVPLLCLGVLMVTMIGSRWTVAFYAVATIALVVQIGDLSAQVTPGAGDVVIIERRMMQVFLVVFLIGVTSRALSRMAYTALRRLEAAADRAYKAEAARADFLAKMSHEIRTPLHGIMGLSDMLTRTKLSESQARPIELISASANNLMDIVNEVLDMAKLEDGELTIASEPFNPHQLIQDLCDLFAVRASDKDLWVGADLPDTLPERLIGDAAHLRQILSNLLGNAIKFTQSGGVRVGARRVDTCDAVAAIQFYVQDTGVGIASEEQASVFDRFSQTESAKSSMTKGTGLGLSICRELTEMMGGTLELHSVVGQGTTFHFTLRLPIANMDADAAA
ncbi:MAG: ATP-binding protein [Pseudomonadota bacterium]